MDQILSCMFTYFDHCVGFVLVVIVITRNFISCWPVKISHFHLYLLQKNKRSNSMHFALNAVNAMFAIMCVCVSLTLSHSIHFVETLPTYKTGVRVQKTAIDSNICLTISNSDFFIRSKCVKNHWNENKEPLLVSRLKWFISKSNSTT